MSFTVPLPPRQPRRGVATRVVLLLISMALAVAYASMRSQTTASLVQRNAALRTSARQAAMTGMTVETCRGKLVLRDCNNQLDAPSYVGEVVDVPEYTFPIFNPKTMIVVKGHEVWVPSCEEVRRMQKKRT